MNKVISADGTPIAYDRIGDGPPLIVVSGATATRTAVASTAEGVATHFTVFNYDRRGRGDSGDTAPYAVEREVEDIAALIGAADGSAFVLGHSSGAVLALEAAKAGLAIEKLALYEPPFIIDDSRPPVPDDYVPHLQELIATDRRAEAYEYLMTAAVGIPAEYMDQIRSSPYWESSLAVAHTISYDGQIMGDTMRGDPAVLKRFAEITTPTLVMVGSESPPYQHNAVQTLANLMPNAQMRVMAGQDHGVAPEVLEPVLVEFLLDS